MFKGGEIFFEHVDADDLFCIFLQEHGSRTQKHDSRLMVSSTKPQRYTKCFYRTSRHPRIFRNNHRDAFRHRQATAVTAISYVKARKRSQPSIIPDSTTRPDNETRESIVVVNTPCC